MNSDSGGAATISISTLCLLWGIITQCLNWGEVIQWPWYAIWGPFLFIVMAWIIAIVVVSVFLLVLNIRRRF